MLVEGENNDQMSQCGVGLLEMNYSIIVVSWFYYPAVLKFYFHLFYGYILAC